MRAPRLPSGAAALATLALAAGAFILCRALLQSRLGQYWLAIREDAEAAQAVGVPVLRCKMIAIVISAALSARL